MRILAITLVGLVLAFAGIASAQVKPRPVLALNKTSMTLRGQHFKPNAQVVLRVRGTKLATFKLRTDPFGKFQVQLIGPAYSTCGGLKALAVGVAGERASLGLGTPACRTQLPDLHIPPLDK